LPGSHLSLIQEIDFTLSLEKIISDLVKSTVSEEHLSEKFCYSCFSAGKVFKL